jgi:hypothetical protein
VTVDGENEEPGGLLGYFRDQPARFFAWWGGIVFVAGWSGVIYLAILSDFPAPAELSTYQRVQTAVSLGASVSIASAILWGIAAYIWIHVLPLEADEPGASGETPPSGR